MKTNLLSFAQKNTKQTKNETKQKPNKQKTNQKTKKQTKKRKNKKKQNPQKLLLFTSSIASIRAHNKSR